MSNREPMRPEKANVRKGKGSWDPEGKHPVYEGLTERFTAPPGLAAAKGYSQEGQRLEKIKYSHDAMIDMIIAEPRITQNELATRFQYSVPWVSRVMGSDAFQAALAERKAQIVDPYLIATTEERLKGLAHQSMDIIAEKLAATQNLDAALKVADMTVKALGFGAREKPGGGAAVQNNFVVNLPPKARDAESWAEAANRGEYSGALKPASPSPVGPETAYLSTTITRDPTVQPDSMKTIEE